MNKVKLALFDLDNTLLGGDSDYLWGAYLADIGVLDADDHREKNDAFFLQYQNNTLDIEEFLVYQLAPLAAYPRSQLEQWRDGFVESCIRPIVLDKGRALVEEHRDAGHELGIVTATNRFITEPIAALFGVETLIAIEVEEIEGRYTGRHSGVPSSGAGKVVRVKQHYGDSVLEERETWFYSDSVRDLPLLSIVDHPVVVNGDAELIGHATRLGWPMLSTAL